MTRTVALIASVVILAACSVGSDADRTRSVNASALYAYPFDDLEDWVSYSDAVVVATVTSVERIAPGPEEADAVARGEGVLVSRLVTIEVEQVLWHGSTQEVPPKLTFTTDGWVLRNFEEVPFGNSGEVRVEIGGQYLLALEAAGDFGTIRRGVLPIEPDGHVSSAGRTDEAAAQLDGLPLDEVAAKLISTEPKAVADANRHLDPEDRYREMVRMSRATPGG